MALFDLKTRADLQFLIDNKIFENKELEYKAFSFINGKLEEKQKNKLVQEVAAFANTNGGSIVIGIQEDENRFPATLCGTGMSMGDFDNWRSSFQQSVRSRIRPPLHGVDYTPVELEENNIAIVITVTKSYARPHSFWDGNKDEFFMRYVNGIAPMDIDDLRREFLYTNGLQDKIRKFRRDRISLILANECVGDLGSDAKIVFHIIPEWSLELGNTVDLHFFEGNSSFRPITGSGWDYRYNADGYCIYAEDYTTNAINCYTQVFHSGIIEATEIRLVSRYKPRFIYNWRDLLGAAKDRITEYADLLEELKIPKPWHISASLLNAKGYATDTGWDTSEQIDRDVVNSLDGLCTEDISVEIALKPVFDSLSNALGLDQSGLVISS